MKYKVCLTARAKPVNGSGILVIEPDDYTDKEIKALKNCGYKVLAYLSIGTIEKERPWYKKYKDCGLKKLDDWPKEVYADVRKSVWQAFVVSRAKALKKKGLDGWWCDNIDVYSEYKSKGMFVAIQTVLKTIQDLGGYVMVNGGSEWLDDALDKNLKIKNYIDGYTQEEVFSRITDYSGKGKFGKQKQGDSLYYQSMIKRVIKSGADGFLLEYTRDAKLKDQIKAWCKKNGASYYISGDVNL